MVLESEIFAKFNTEVLLLTGAGASQPLGMPLMTEFYDQITIKADSMQKECHIGREKGNETCVLN